MELNEDLDLIMQLKLPKSKEVSSTRDKLRFIERIEFWHKDYLMRICKDDPALLELAEIDSPVFVKVKLALERMEKL